MEETHRGPVMIGQLPPDFLVSDGQMNRDRGEAASVRAAETLAARETTPGGPPVGLQPGQVAANPAQYVTVGRLSVTVVEAKLAKNYSLLGLARMDPYCRLRVGHNVYETETAHNGAKNPTWGKTIYATLPTGVDSFTVEIFDEKSFTSDERVAWAVVQIPQNVVDGETKEEWVPLNGKQGPAQEGQVNLILSYQKYQQPAYTGHNPYLIAAPGGPPLVMPTQQRQPMPQVQITDQDIDQIHEMFPTTDKTVIKTILIANGGNKDATINSLLSMA